VRPRVCEEGKGGGVPRINGKGEKKKYCHSLKKKPFEIREKRKREKKKGRSQKEEMLIRQEKDDAIPQGPRLMSRKEDPGERGRL